MKKKNTSQKKSRPSESKEQSLLGSVAHTLGDAMAVAVGVAADTVTKLEEGVEPRKQSRPKTKQSASRTKAKPKRAKNRTALKK